MRIEGDYVVIHDGAGRIAGHFGIQRDVTDRHRVTEDIRASRQQLRALASRLQAVREFSIAFRWPALHSASRSTRPNAWRTSSCAAAALRR